MPKDPNTINKIQAHSLYTLLNKVQSGRIAFGKAQHWDLEESFFERVYELEIIVLTGETLPPGENREDLFRFLNKHLGDSHNISMNPWRTLDKMIPRKKLFF